MFDEIGLPYNFRTYSMHSKSAQEVNLGHILIKSGHFQ